MINGQTGIKARRDTHRRLLTSISILVTEGHRYWQREKINYHKAKDRTLCTCRVTVQTLLCRVSWRRRWDTDWSIYEADQWSGGGHCRWVLWNGLARHCTACYCDEPEWHLAGRRQHGDAGERHVPKEKRRWIGRWLAAAATMSKRPLTWTGELALLLAFSCLRVPAERCSSLSLPFSLTHFERRSSHCASFLPLSDQVSQSFNLSVCRQDGGILKEASAGEQANRCHRQQWLFSSIRCPTSLVFASCATEHSCVHRFTFRAREPACPDAPDHPGGQHNRLHDESSLMMPFDGNVKVHIDSSSLSSCCCITFSCILKHCLLSMINLHCLTLARQCTTQFPFTNDASAYDAPFRWEIDLPTSGWTRW